MPKIHGMLASFCVCRDVYMSTCVCEYVLVFISVLADVFTCLCIGLEMSVCNYNCVKLFDYSGIEALE